MSTTKLKSYRFVKEPHWNACLFTGRDRDSRRLRGGIVPAAPYGLPGTLYESSGAQAPVVTRGGEILWCDDQGAIQRLSPSDDKPQSCAAPPALAGAQRIVATASGLWVMGPTSTLQRFDEQTLTRLLTVDLSSVQVIDIAAGSKGCVFVLAQEAGLWQIFSFDRWGRVVNNVELVGLSQPASLVYLRRSQQFVVLTGDRYPRLCWFSGERGSPLHTVPVTEMRRCFEARVLGSDSQDRIFVGGVDNEPLTGRLQTRSKPWYVVIYDAECQRLGEVPLEPRDVPLTGIAASRDSLHVTGPRGLTKFAVAEVVSEGTGIAECKLVTPVLFSPDREDRRRWLRIEATADLPLGCTLSIEWAATDKDEVPDRLKKLTANNSVPAGRRMAALLAEPELQWSRTDFQGTASRSAPFPDSARRAKQRPKTFSAKLFDVSERFLWVSVTLTAAPGARLPRLQQLAIYYPGRTLMEDLPAIYQREESNPGSFLRALVGVLETSTQDLDARIGALGHQVHPATADETWLNYLARWLGLPWDDALSKDQKRKILQRAADLAQGRGTRTSLETLLECLVPGVADMPRRFRVTDATADYGFACLGSGSRAGTRLPAILAATPCGIAELGATAVLGRTRLDGAKSLDDGVSQFAGKVRVEVAATAAERKAWEPWLLSLLTEMVPLATTVDLRWVALQALRVNRLDSTLALEPKLGAQLGTDAITGLAHLPQGEDSLSPRGPGIGWRLG